MKAFTKIAAGLLSCAMLLGMTSCGSSSKKGLKILETPYAIEDYAMAINKDNEGLKAAIDQALAELTDDGTIPGIIEAGAGIVKQLMQGVTQGAPAFVSGLTDLISTAASGFAKEFPAFRAASS